MTAVGPLTNGEHYIPDGPRLESTNRVGLVTFMDYDLGYFDEETSKLEPLEYPFAPEIE